LRRSSIWQHISAYVPPHSWAESLGEAVQRNSPVAGGTVIGVTAGKIMINTATALMFMSGRQDLNIQGAFLHMASDAIIVS